jgi:hypothetical protein
MHACTLARVRKQCASSARLVLMSRGARAGVRACALACACVCACVLVVALARVASAAARACRDIDLSVLEQRDGADVLHVRAHTSVAVDADARRVAAWLPLVTRPAGGAASPPPPAQRVVLVRAHDDGGEECSAVVARALVALVDALGARVTSTFALGVDRDRDVCVAADRQRWSLRDASALGLGRHALPVRVRVERSVRVVFNESAVGSCAPSAADALRALRASGARDPPPGALSSIASCWLRPDGGGGGGGGCGDDDDADEWWSFVRESWRDSERRARLPLTLLDAAVLPADAQAGGAVVVRETSEWQPLAPGASDDEQRGLVDDLLALVHASSTAQLAALPLIDEDVGAALGHLDAAVRLAPPLSGAWRNRALALAVATDVKAIRAVGSATVASAYVAVRLNNTDLFAHLVLLSALVDELSVNGTAPVRQPCASPRAHAPRAPAPAADGYVAEVGAVFGVDAVSHELFANVCCWFMARGLYRRARSWCARRRCIRVRAAPHSLACGSVGVVSRLGAHAGAEDLARLLPLSTGPPLHLARPHAAEFHRQAAVLGGRGVAVVCGPDAARLPAEVIRTRAARDWPVLCTSAWRAPARAA